MQLIHYVGMFYFNEDDANSYKLKTFYCSTNFLLIFFFLCETIQEGCDTLQEILVGFIHPICSPVPVDGGKINSTRNGSQECD